MDWLFRTNFDPTTTIALWSIAGVLVTTLILFVYTMGLRFVTVSSSRRRRRFLSAWRDVFAAALLSRRAAERIRLPVVKRDERTDLLEEWNRACSIVAGDAAENLVVLARRTEIPSLARSLLAKRRISSKILAVQTLGHLRDTSMRDEIRSLIEHDNTALSITAAMALVAIDPDLGISIVVPLIEQRRDWPKNRVSVLLRMAGSERISEPLYRAIRSADDDTKTYLLGFAWLIEAQALDALVIDLLRESTDPGVLNASLKLVSGFSGVPRIASLTQHAAWFVRMQAAKVLGRIGQEEHLSLLEAMLDDREWWVRYRAAQAITSLPFLGPNELRRLRDRQTDRYASDMMQQTLAEAGLA